jgi:large subunit ribosomal protein L35
MAKKKTKKSAAKRFRKTAGGKITFPRPGRGHLLTSKGQKRKQDLRRRGRLSKAMTKRMLDMITS